MVLYLVFCVVWACLMIRYAGALRRTSVDIEEPTTDPTASPRDPALTY